MRSDGRFEQNESPYGARRPGLGVPRIRTGPPFGAAAFRFSTGAPGANQAKCFAVAPTPGFIAPSMLHPACFSTVFDADIPPDGFPRRWAIVTAHARTGTVRPFLEDACADTALAAEIDRLGLRRWRVTGRSDSGDHAEPGWGVDCDAARARDLGRQFDQAAIFWVVDGDLLGGECGEGVSGVKVGALAPRLNPPVSGLGGEATFGKFAGGDTSRRAALLRFLGEPSERASSFASLLAESDESDYSAADWCAAAAEFQNRLEVAGRVSPFAHKLGYLSCCASAIARIPPALRPSLTEAFIAMWFEYGYEG